MRSWTCTSCPVATARVDARRRARTFTAHTSLFGSQTFKARRLLSRQCAVGGYRRVYSSGVDYLNKKTEPWWAEDGDLWEIVDNADEFQRAVRTGDHEVVVVDWFATWCAGCRKSAPFMKKLAADPDLRERVKFVKACADGMAGTARSAGARALPWVSVFSPEGTSLVGFPAAASKHRNFRLNVETVLKNPGKAYTLDPNGFVIAVAPTLKSEQQKKKEEALEELRNFASGFSDRFSKSPLVTSVPETESRQEVEMRQTQTSGETREAVDIKSISEEKAAFLEAHSESYGYEGRIDELYKKEVGCRMQPNEHYMDYTGSSVYCQSQIDAAFDELKSNMFGNPHSQNPSSRLTQEGVEDAREMVLRFFNADPKEYQVVFTKSATAALKMVGETFPWCTASEFRYLRENHNSVLGIREYVLAKGATFQSIDERLVESWLHKGIDIDDPAGGNGSGEVANLFAFPAEDNFAGVKYPLRWIEELKEKSTEGSKWYSVLDAAAHVPTQPLDLSKYHPDFVAISFYKMFGFPTGLGALIARVDATDVLKKVFWAGGSVALATSKDNFHTFKCRPSDRLEDGTVAFLDIINLKHGFRMMEELGGISRIQAHVESLRGWLYHRLVSLRHSGGEAMTRIFGKHHLPHPEMLQGGILNFEVCRPDGSAYSYRTFEREAADAGFHVRTGIECNPGAAYNYIGIDESEVEQLAGEKEGCDDEVEFLTVERPVGGGPTRAQDSDQVLYALEGSEVALGHPGEVALKWAQVPLGSIRVSLGYMSTFEDCAALVEFIEKNYRDRA
ncbi:hypothetical protein BSKO_01641 [Bryopsis sp. KO-2023]|nr:hypothetical protein BSKO_01641 [Bryopsis sp. KO-2023]